MASSGFGNKVPHPAVIFLILLAAVIVLSHVFYLLGTSVSYETIDMQTDAVIQNTTTVNSLLTTDGIRFIFTSMIRNFMSFGPVGVILVAMIGVGLAEEAGLIKALIKKIVSVAPRQTITFIIVFLGILSSIASDAGYLVLVPLGAAAFLSVGRHPLAGIAAAFAGVAAVFLVNVIITPIDGILTELTNDAIHLLDPIALDRPDRQLLLLGRLQPAAGGGLHGHHGPGRRAPSRHLSWRGPRRHQRRAFVLRIEGPAGGLLGPRGGRRADRAADLPRRCAAAPPPSGPALRR